MIDWIHNIASTAASNNAIPIWVYELFLYMGLAVIALTAFQFTADVIRRYRDGKSLSEISHDLLNEDIEKTNRIADKVMGLKNRFKHQ